MAPIALICESDSKEYILEQDVITIGRSRDNDIIIENLNVSRSHARIRVEGGKYILTDLNSSNGTLVNNERVSKTELKEGDVISIGRVELKFTVPELLEDDTVMSSVEVFEGSGAPPVGATVPDSSVEEGQVEGSDEIPPPPQANLDYSDIEMAPPLEPGQPFVPVLRISKGKNSWQYQIDKPETSIGKAKSNEIVLPDIFASKQHAMIEGNGDSFKIKDLGSWRGTMVNGDPLKENDGLRELQHNDVIQIGSCRLHFVHEPITEGEMPEGAKATMAMEDSAVHGEGFVDESIQQPAEQPQGVEGVVEFQDGEDAFMESAASDEAEAAPQESGMPSVDDQFIAVFIENADVVYTEKNKLTLPHLEEDVAVAVQEAPAEEVVAEQGDFIQEAAVDTGAPVEPEELELEDTPAQTASPDGVEIFSHSSNSELDVLELDSETDVSPVVAQILKERDAEEDAEDGLDQPQPGEQPVEEQEQAVVEEEAEEAEPEKQEEEEQAEEDQEEKEEKKPTSKSKKKKAKPEKVTTDVDDPNAQKEVKLWERALQNPSPAIRKEALKRLKQLTGKDYDES